MQQILIAGDTLAFDTVLADYPAGSGWTLVYRLVPRTAGPSAIEITASADGDTHSVEVSATTTALWTAGEYSWSGYVSKAGERHTVESGTITIKPDPAVITSQDARSTARQILDALLELQASNAVSQGHVSEYSIAGRTMRFRDTADLITQIQYWRAEVAREDRAARIAAGLDAGGRILVRM